MKGNGNEREVEEEKREEKRKREMEDEIVNKVTTRGPEEGTIARDDEGTRASCVLSIFEGKRIRKSRLPLYGYGEILDGDLGTLWGIIQCDSNRTLNWMHRRCTT
jgi:hypothetical protein